MRAPPITFCHEYVTSSSLPIGTKRRSTAEEASQMPTFAVVGDPNRAALAHPEVVRSK